MEKSELIIQTKVAFDFLQKLYYEVSYLIKEIEGLLAQEEEGFIFGRTSGYAVTARSSNGLDAFSVGYWMYKKLAVFFVPAAATQIVKGQTVTHFRDDLKILYFRIVLDEKDLSQPMIYYGVMKNFVKKSTIGAEKIEHLMATIEYNEKRVFDNMNDFRYEDGNVKFNGSLANIPLYDINSGEDVAEKLIAPALKMYREA